MPLSINKSTSPLDKVNIRLLICTVKFLRGNCESNYIFELEKGFPQKSLVHLVILDVDMTVLDAVTSEE